MDKVKPWITNRIYSVLDMFVNVNSCTTLELNNLNRETKNFKLRVVTIM